MTHPEPVDEDVIDDIENVDDIEDIEDIEVIKPIEPGSLEWFRQRAPLPLLFEALLEVPDNRGEFGRYEDETAKSACENHTSFWKMLFETEMQAELFETFDDPNAKAIAARLKGLTGCRAKFLTLFREI